ncbi:hypothetical protein LTR17_027841, partial [Elasticomyces elasticus]
MARGDFQHAIRLQESVLAWLSKHYGEDHPQALVTEANLGGSYHKLQQWQKALELQTDTLETMRAIFGPDHFETILTTINTGWTYYQLGLFEEAEDLLTDALPSWRTEFDESHPNTILARMMLAKTLEMQGKSHEAWKQMAAVATARLYKDTIETRFFCAWLSLADEDRDRSEDCDLTRRIEEAQRWSCNNWLFTIEDSLGSEMKL